MKDDDVRVLLDTSVSVCEFWLVDFLLNVEVVEVVEVVVVSSSSSLPSSSMTFSAS